jgi:hypothetical protein
VLLGLAAQLVTHRFGVSEPVWRLDGFRFALNGLLSQATSAALSGMGILLLVFFVALLTRSQIAAAVIVSLFFAAIAAVNNGGAPVLTMMFGAATVGLLLATLVRFGLLALVVSIFVVAVLDGYPLTIDLRIWYGATSLLMIGVVVALTIFGFRSAIGGRSLVGTLLDD